MRSVLAKRASCRWKLPYSRLPFYQLRTTLQKSTVSGAKKIRNLLLRDDGPRKPDREYLIGSSQVTQPLDGHESLRLCAGLCAKLYIEGVQEAGVLALEDQQDLNLVPFDAKP